MTEEVMEQVREKIEQWDAVHNSTAKEIQRRDPNELEDFIEYSYGELARQILSIPEILIKDPDQSLPKSSFLVSMYESMLKPDKNGAVWVKVLPK